MNQLLTQALRIAELHHRAKITALSAEQMLLDLGFYSVTFDKGGLAGASYLGVRYDLGESHAAR